MSSDRAAIRVRDISKHYLLFDRPEDRLKQMVVPRMERLLGRPARRYYRDFAALNNVSFEVKRGETVGIVGRNGSGKSTLLQIICGTVRPSHGTVEVDGRIAALLELGAGFNPEFTGRENVYVNGAILGLARREIDERFDRIAAFADIGMFINQPVKTYSSGMSVRLAFATAVNVDPDILVVDEALAVGDEAFQRKCFARIEEIQDKGGTILFVSHSPQTVVQLCGRAMLIDGGELLLEGSPKMVVSQHQRLANASAEAAATMRSEILKLRRASAAETEVTLSTAELDDEEVSANHHAVLAPAESLISAPSPAIVPAADYYDPDLKSQSVVHLDERGARIHDTRILTLNGEPVNVLRMDRRYVFEYFVDFKLDVRNVGFGMSIRTVDGRVIAAAQSLRSRAMRIEHVPGRTQARVEYAFSSLMLPGTYFLSCGVVGLIDGGDPVVLNRIFDAVMCRVIPEPDLISSGLVDLNLIPTIRLAPSHERIRDGREPA